MYAVDALGDAIDVTREFLTPIRVRTWLKLAVVVFFIFGASSVGTPTAPTGGQPTGPSDDVQFEVDDTVTIVDPATGERIDLGLTESELLTLVLVGVALAILVWLVYAIVGAIMEFAFVESLRTGEVHVRRYGGRHLGRAMRLFGFRLLTGLLVAALVGIPAYLVLAPIDGPGSVSLSALGAFAVLAFVVSLVYALFMRLTTEFVVPVMVLEERTVLGAWSRFWPTLTGNLAEYAVYVVLATIIGFVASIAITVLWGFAALLLAIPFVILGAIFVLLGPIGAVALIPLGIVAVVAFLLLLALFHVPLVAYIRYYALLVLGDTNGDLDLIPEQRTAVRAGADWAREDGRDGGSGAGDSGWNDGDSGWGNDDDGDDGRGDGDDDTGWR